MKQTFKHMLAGSFMMATSAAMAQTPAAEFNADFGSSGAVAVDCDLLGPRGALSAAFIMQLDPSGHFKSNPNTLKQIEAAARHNEGISADRDVPETTLIPYLVAHIGLHGISETRVNGVAQACRDNFLTPD